nr:hypothetical protein [uncultured Comamonas sp.]
MKQFACLTFAVLLLVGCGAADRELVGQAQSAVREKLKDPSSAKFERTFVLPHPDTSTKYAQLKSACGFVNAKNSFGAYTGSVRFVVLLGIPSGERNFEVLDTNLEQVPDDEMFKKSFWDNVCELSAA